MSDFLTEIMEKPRFYIYRGALYLSIALLIIGILARSWVTLTIAGVLLAVLIYVQYCIIETIHAGKAALQDIIDNREKEVMRLRDFQDDVLHKVDSALDELDTRLGKAGLSEEEYKDINDILKNIRF